MTLEMTSKKPPSSTASASDVFSFQLEDDDDGMSTLKRNVAKSGILPGSSTLQRLPKGLPETIEEKDKSAEVANVESLEEEEATTTFKFPADLLVNDVLENVDAFSYSGDIDLDIENTTCTFLDLPAMSSSVSNPSLQSMTSETDVYVTSFTNPLLMMENKETRL